MKSIILALGVGLATFALTGTASAQQPTSGVPVVYPSGTVVYVNGGCPQTIYYRYPVTRVYYSNCVPTYCAPACTTTYRTYSYPVYSYSSSSCQPRVTYRSRWCR